MIDFAKGLANRGKKRIRNAESTSHETASINSAASGSTISQSAINITSPRRAATMEPQRSRGLLVPPSPPSGPVMSITQGVPENTAIISQTSSPQRKNSHHEVTTRTTINSTANKTTTSTITTRKSTRVVEERAVQVQKHVNQLSTESKAHPKPKVTHITLESYLESILNERLSRMPNRGSAWDRVLHAAQFFGLHISDFGDKIDSFVNGKKSNTSIHGTSANNGAREGVAQDSFSNGQKNTVSVNGATDLVTTALTASYALLEIGHTQAQYLLPTFSALYELSLLLTDIIRVHNLEQPSEAIQYAAIRTFHGLIVLLSSLGALYRRNISNLKPGSSEIISFDSHFRAEIEQIWRSKETLSDEIWKQKLEEAGLSIDINQLRSKLQPFSSYSVSNGIYEKVDEHVDLPNEVGYWLKHVLSDFLDTNDQLLCVTGNESSGKTFLAGWIEERLARPVKVKSNHVLRYDFPYDLPNKPTPAAFLKSILSKLLEQNVGNIEVYRSILQAFEKHSDGADSEPTEPLLWQALHDSLEAVRIKHALIVILLDGCDELAGGNAEFYEKLQSCTFGLSNVRVVTFSRSVPHEVRNYEHAIDASKVRKDIKAYFREILSRSCTFDKLSFKEREEISENMAAKANGDWLWTFFAARFLSKEQSKASLINLSRNIGSKTLDVIFKTVEMLELENCHSWKTHSLKTLLSTMVVATRPLTIAEVAQLLSIDLHLHTDSMSPTPFDVVALISESCYGLVVLKDGHVRFRTKAIRAFMEKQLGSMSLPTEKEAHRQLTLIILLYAKLTLKGDAEPNVDAQDSGLALSIVSADSLLEYVVQNWIKHFQASGLTEPEVLRAFPGSAMFVLLEKIYWARAFTNEQLILNHELALKVRQACFGEHIVVFHALVSLGDVYLNVVGSKPDAAWYFYKAAKLGEKILTEKSTIVHSFVHSCMNFFFDYVATLDMIGRVKITTLHNKESIDIVECYDEMIQLAIKIDQNDHGYSSDEVISWYKGLAKLYIDIREEERVIDVYKDLYTAIVARHGDTSEEAKQVYRYFVTLDIVFNDPSVDRVGELEQLIFGIGKEFTDFLYVRNWIWLANTFEQCKHFFEAERLYVSLWQNITITCDRKADVNINTIKIDIALEYAKFLRRQGRVQDASSILICLSAEYKEYEHTVNDKSDTSESVIKYFMRIRDVAEECRAIGLASIAISILTKVWKSLNLKGHNKETQNTAVLITEVVEEITETTTTITTVTETTEKVVKELFEHLVGQYQQSKSDAALFSASKALIGLYNQQRNWRDAEAALKRTLEFTWKEVLTTGSEIKLCEHSIEESLDLARRLAECYSNQGLFSMAEKIHLQMFVACSGPKLEANLRTKSNPLTGAKLFEEAIAGLVGFYEKHHRHEEVINAYTKVLHKYEEELGKKHESTIRILYLLADYHKMLGSEEAYKYYDKIVQLLNEGIDYCHHDAFKAALALCQHYDARRIWSSLQGICETLWETIIQHREQLVVDGESKISGEIIASVYDKYSHVLQSHAKAEFSKQYNVAVQYRDVISNTYKDELLVVNTLIALAKICETHKEYYEVSVAAYEEVLKKINTGITTDTTVQTVKKRLSTMYVRIVRESQTITVPLDRAIEISLETYDQHKAEFKTDPEQTLVHLENVIILYKKLNTSESQQRIYEFLETAVRYIVTIAVVNMELFRAAKELAALFVSTGLGQKGNELLHNMRQSIIYGGKYQDTQSDLESQMRKVVFVFLIVFGHGLEQLGEGLSYSRIMTDNVLESLLFEEYSQKINGEAKIEIILENGAKLRHFWHNHKRTGFIETLDQDLMNRFKKAFAQYFEANSSDEVKQCFYYRLMKELGEDRPTIKFDFETFMLQVGNKLVKDLLDEGDFDKANQIGRFVCHFSRAKKLYHNLSRIRYGYILAQYLVGIGASHPDNDVHKRAMLETSLDLMSDVIDAFNILKIAFETLPSEDLVGLVHLLHRQGNYEQVERVLSPLWRLRSDLPTMIGSNSQTIAEIGTCLVHAQCAQNRWDVAIDTASELYYNLQRGLGRLDSETLAVSQLLASIFATVASNGELRYASYAMDIHEAVLTEIYSDSERVYNGYTRRDDQFLDNKTRFHFELLKELLSQFKEFQLKDSAKREEKFRDLSVKLNSDLMLDGGARDPPSWQYTLPTTWKFGELKEEATAKATYSLSNTNTLETSKREWVLASAIFY